MLQHYAQSMVELPVPDRERICTDKVCAILGPVFFAVMLGLAIGFRNGAFLEKIDFSLDSQMRTCGQDLVEYPFVYYPDVNDFEKRLCVAKCPRIGDARVECKPLKTLDCPTAETILDSQSINTDHGNYCLPKFGSFRDKVIVKSGIVQLRNQKITLKIAQACIPLGLCFGLLYLVLVQFFPKCMIWTSLFGSGACLITLSLLVFSDWSSIWTGHKVLQIGIGICLLLLGFTMIAVVWVYRGQIEFWIMLRQYSPMLFVYIPIYTAITIIFMALCYFQHITFYNFYPPQLAISKHYFESTPNYPLVILNIFGFFWGLNILRDSFSYIISGNAVEWYFTHQPTHITLPLKRMLENNIGSIFGGAYLNTLFLIPSMIFDAVTCQQKALSNYYQNGCNNGCFHSFLSFVNIARKDSYSYINLTGIQYCNAARQCQQLCARSPLFPGSHSCLLPFRMAFHLFSLLPVIIITIFYLMRIGSGGQFHFYPVLLVAFLSFCLLTYFIDIHADVAEGLQICNFVQEQFNQINPSGVWVGIINLKTQVQTAGLRYSRIGNITPM